MRSDRIRRPEGLQRFSDPLPITEHFYTLQGEGSHSGKAAYFIRTAGCDVGCVWCDVKESWPQEGYPLLSTSELADYAAQHPARLAVVTGGEPLMHDLDPLCLSLKQKGFNTHIESSGAYPISGTWDWFCLSPKKFKAPLAEAYAAADELKVIIFNQSDFAFAEQEASKVGKDCVLYLQPEWDREKEMLPGIVDYVKSNPQWQISLQTHKYLQIP